MSRSPRGTTTGGYFFKVVIFIKFKKFIVVALAVLCVVVASCVSAFAVSDSYDRNKVIDSLKSNDKVKEFTQGKNYFAVVNEGSSRTFVDVYVSKNQYLVSVNSINIPNDDCDLYRFSILSDSSVRFDERVGTFSDYYCQLNNSNDMSSGCLLVSNYDLKTTKGEVFFDNPSLLKQLLKPVRKQVGEKVVADLGTLTVCGIGCLALLVGCSLVPKVLHKFRV